ncbi:glycosyltransferase family 4 protein [Magnetovibrio sp. PR-2]|uniref:glycosyltransferase family 4 protein n=1 Tax=Magnetovibrio sp. PR-2 TaxID=3120356 RepID=UPI002FCE5F99
MPHSTVSTLSSEQGRSVLFLYPGTARDSRMDLVKQGRAPKDFFYGLPHIQSCGFDVSIGNTRKDPKGALNRGVLMYERIRNRYLNFGLSVSRVNAIADQIGGADIALSFNDFFSLSMGLYRSNIPGQMRLLGGFHGLSDLVERPPSMFRGYAKSQLMKAIEGLDHLFFSGEVDREKAIEMFSIPREKTSYYPFGVDAEFWRPDDKPYEAETVLSVGSDPSRDFATLINANIQDLVRIITRLNVGGGDVPDNVEIVRGSLFGSEITDEKLRELYQHAKVIVVPVRDVWQPSGCSVTLQAMACGKAVVISDIKGLWDRDQLKSGENCLLVPPGDPKALKDAVEGLNSDPKWREEMGRAARKTVDDHFSISRMDHALEKIVRDQLDYIR